jgi:hypothetical protein
MNTKFSDLVGKTLSAVRENSDDEIVFTSVDGETFKLLHCQECCESVVIEDICGDLDDLVGVPILLAEEAESAECPPDSKSCNDSNTWTFYKLRTIKGSVDIRWHGSSNGYYSESVDFIKVEDV